MRCCEAGLAFLPIGFDAKDLVLETDSERTNDAARLRYIQLGHEKRELKNAQTLAPTAEIFSDVVRDVARSPWEGCFVGDAMEAAMAESS